MNASHFRNRAQKARELARTGDDPRLVEMLLEVARDMDAEADAIEAAATSAIGALQPGAVPEPASPSAPRPDPEGRTRQVREAAGYAIVRSNAHTVAA